MNEVRTLAVLLIATLPLLSNCGFPPGNLKHQSLQVQDSHESPPFDIEASILLLETIEVEYRLPNSMAGGSQMNTYGQIEREISKILNERSFYEIVHRISQRSRPCQFATLSHARLLAAIGVGNQKINDDYVSIRSHDLPDPVEWSRLLNAAIEEGLEIRFRN